MTYSFIKVDNVWMLEGSSKDFYEFLVKKEKPAYFELGYSLKRLRLYNRISSRIDKGIMDLSRKYLLAIHAIHSIQLLYPYSNHITNDNMNYWLLYNIPYLTEEYNKILQRINDYLERTDYLFSMIGF